MASLGEILRSRLFRRTVAVALLAVAVAACIGDTSTCANGSSGRCVTKARSGANASEITGSAPARAAPAPRHAGAPVPLPALRQPQTVAAHPSAPACKPASRSSRVAASRLDITGLIKRTSLRGPLSAPAGGFMVTVGRGETVDALARRYGVSATAIRQANRLPERASVWSGQRLVIPRAA